MVMVGQVHVCATPEPRSYHPRFPGYWRFPSTLAEVGLPAHNPSLTLMKNGIQLMSYSIGIVPAAADQ